MTSATIGVLVSLVFAVAAVAQIVIGHLLDRVGARPLLPPVALLQALCLLNECGRAVGLGDARDRRADDAARVRRDPDRVVAGRRSRRAGSRACSPCNTCSRSGSAPRWCR